MKSAVLTGITGGIGQAAAEVLEKNGYNVIGITSRLENTEALVEEAEVINRNNIVYALINCAGFGIFRPHEEISVPDINRMISVNLAAPVILSKIFLRELKRNSGWIVNITSIEALKHSKFSALYTATKAGLRAFSLSLFEEARRSGVKTVSINPGMTRTGFFDNLNFEPAEGEENALDPYEIASVVLELLDGNGSAAVTDITIVPQKIGVKKKKRRNAE